MRYSLLTAALAAGVFSSPLIVRDEVTEYAVVTAVVTVTAGAAPATTSAVSVAAVPTSSKKWWGSWHWSHTKAPAPAKTTAAPSPKTTSTTSAAPVVTVTAQAESSSAPAPKPSTTQAAASTPSSSYSGGTPSFSDIVVMHHNIHRKNHSVSDVSWDQGLADIAQTIGESCNYAHNVVAGGGGYGQNIAAGAPADNISSIITEQFYNAELPWFTPYFGEATPSDMSDATFDHFGHFTQIVWKGSTKVGCAVVDCTGKGNGPNGLGSVASDVPPYFTVCNYSPPGNYLGEFNTNVNKPNGEPTASWDYGL